jgi:signal transduction histidine kinase/ActR/RegA family two-component response regulator
MRLTTRLMLLVLVCLLPTVTLGIFVQIEERAERKAQLSDLVLRQAELLNGDILSITQGARSLLVTAAEFDSVHRLDPSCADRLRAIKRNLPSYAFLALVDGDGAVVCASTPDLGPVTAGHPAWVRDALDAEGFRVGRYATVPGMASGFLPFFLPVEVSASGRRGILVAALDLAWLANHLVELKTLDARLPHDSVLSVADRDGVILARNPRHAEFVGKRFPPAALKLTNAPLPGVVRLASVDGMNRLVGYVPTTHSGSGLMVAAGFFEPDLMGSINRATLIGASLLAAATLAAFVLTLLAGRRFIGRPTTQLVSAARRWREGDFRARAAVSTENSEFGQIAAAYNEMAAALETRDAELRQHAQLLEARVDERTRKLSETNNRLQVEIEERKETEAALVQSQKLQTVGQLAGGIAHDFNNLLATILGNLELLVRDLGPDQARQRAMIERASGAVQRGAQLTGRLLAFTRRRRLTVRATDINKLIADLGALLATSTLGQRIRIETQLDGELWPAMAEPSQVEAAILNLALNGRDAMPEGGILTIATANETLAPSEGADDPPAGCYVRITVSDTGEGMTEAVARRAFDPFFTTKGPFGSGLGLSQVYGMTRESGGTVRIESVPSGGTSVTLLLPRATAFGPAPRRDTAYPALRRWHVLLVDDDEDVREVTAEMLKDLGCLVQQAEDGNEALALLERDGDTPRTVPPDLLLIDYAMPGMTGLALAAAARSRGFAGSVVLATGYAEPAEPDHPGEVVPDAILQKPFTMEELGRVLSRIQAQADTLQHAK